MNFFEIIEEEDKKDLLPLTCSAKEIVGNICGTSYPEVFLKNGDENSFFVFSIGGEVLSLNSLSEIIKLYEISTINY